MKHIFIPENHLYLHYQTFVILSFNTGRFARKFPLMLVGATMNIAKPWLCYTLCEDSLGRVNRWDINFFKAKLHNSSFKLILDNTFILYLFFFFLNLVIYVIKRQYLIIYYEIFSMEFEFLGLYDENLALFMSLWWFFFGVFLSFFFDKKG